MAVSGNTTVTAVGDSVTVQTLLAENLNRQGFKLWNTSTAICKVKLGPTASTTSFSFELAGSGGFYENPGNERYTGIITAVWASDAGGSVLVTEMI